LGLVSAAMSPWHPFSRSYGVILPSSLTILLPPALGFSPHPPVSVYGTGTVRTIAAFLGACPSLSPTSVRSSFGAAFRIRFFLDAGFSNLPRVPFRVVPHIRVPTVLSYRSTGISTCRPSTTALALALGPDLPRADQLDSGNLGYSAWRILTSISLLIPAFSLPVRPLPLPVQLPPHSNAPLPITALAAIPELRRRV
jgi:hypothetical protein